MTEYYVRKGKFGPEVAKFSDSSVPNDVYVFNHRGCTCPARVRNCKHSKMVKEWEKLGRPVGLIFNDYAEVVWEWKL